MASNGALSSVFIDVEADYFNEFLHDDNDIEAEVCLSSSSDDDEEENDAIACLDEGLFNRIHRSTEANEVSSSSNYSSSSPTSTTTNTTTSNTDPVNSPITDDFEEVAVLNLCKCNIGNCLQKLGIITVKKLRCINQSLSKTELDLVLLGKLCIMRQAGEETRWKDTKHKRKDRERVNYDYRHDG